MTAIQCPDCDLRFASERDLDDHLKLDHPDFHVEPKTPEDAILLERRHRNARRHRPEPRNG
jgi:hypothetical protein